MNYNLLLHLPFTSLLRFRSVCKSWRDHIDSKAFRKSHIQHHANDSVDDDTLLVQFSFRKDGVSELSMFNGKLHNNFLKLDLDTTDAVHRAVIAGPANGVICIYYRDSDAPVAVCSPSLGLIAILPVPPNPSSNHHLAIWFDEITRRCSSCLAIYELSFHLHASVYSKATNSWRELAVAGSDMIAHASVYSKVRGARTAPSRTGWRSTRRGRRWSCRGDSGL